MRLSSILKPAFILIGAFLFFITPAHSAEAAAKYWYSTSSTDWATLANWWDDAGHTTPSAGLPGASDTVTLVAGSVVPEADVATWTAPLTINSSAIDGILFISSDSENQTTFEVDITGDAEFDGYVIYGGDEMDPILTGNAVFRNQATNGYTAVITGNADFFDSSNSGQVEGDATFTGESFNTNNSGGTVGGNAVFNNTASNGGGTVTGDAEFNDGSSNGNSGNVGNNAVFNDDSYNTGTVTGDATFNDSSDNNEGTVNGEAVFNGQNENRGSGLADTDVVFGGTSLNLGTISADATFASSSINGGIISGNATFNDSSRNRNDGEVNGTATFNGTSYNGGNVATAVFNDDSFNSGDFDLGEGEVSGNATFNDNAYNEGDVGGTATFTGTYTSDADSNLYPLGFGEVSEVEFTGSVHFITGDGQDWDIDASEWTCASCEWTFNDATLASNGEIVGSSTFNGSSLLQGEANGTTTINGTSVILGTLNGNAFFNDEGTLNSNAIVNGSVTFYNNSPHYENGATVSGDRIRYFSISTSTIALDLVTDGPWILVADGVEVNYGRAQTDDDTVLQEINGGDLFVVSKYWYSTSNADWHSADNWWDDAEHTTPAGAVPTIAEAAITVAGSVTPEIDLAVFEGIDSIDASETGLIVGILLENNNSYGLSGSVIGDVTFYEDAWNFAVITGNAVFHDSTLNRGNISGNAEFYEGARNGGEDTVGTVQGDAIFYGDETLNLGTVGGTRTRIYTEDITTQLNFTAGGIWTVVADGAVVNILNATFDGDTIFEEINGGSFFNPDATTKYWYSTGSTDWNDADNWWLDSGHTTPAEYAPFQIDAAVILGTVVPVVDVEAWEGVVSIDSTAAGNIIFESVQGSTVSVEITGNATFHGVGVENTISGNIEITGEGGLNGTTGGDAEFYDEAFNQGTVLGNATFYGDDTENYGTVNGSSTRIYTETLETERDFTENGPWTVVADGVVVYIPDAIYDETTIFQEINGGSFSSEADAIAPVISDITASEDTDESNITWETNEEASTQVEWGLTSSYGNITDEEDTDPRVEEHHVEITGLSTCTTYHYRVISTDAFENTATSSDQSFTTVGCASSGGGGSSRRSNGTRSKTKTATSTSSSLIASSPVSSSILPSNSSAPLSSSGSGGAFASTTIPVPIQTGSSGGSSRRFTRYLNVGVVGDDVKSLQQYLNEKNFTIASAGPGAPGNETNFFGGLTKNALIRFQASVGLPATGYFGPMTQGVVNSQ